MTNDQAIPTVEALEIAGTDRGGSRRSLAHPHLETLCRFPALKGGRIPFRFLRPLLVSFSLFQC
ncbi:hypothetical protein LINPERHAP1_LOCUS25058 [Linum perenne]